MTNRVDSNFGHLDTSPLVPTGTGNSSARKSNLLNSPQNQAWLKKLKQEKQFSGESSQAQHKRISGGDNVYPQ